MYILIIYIAKPFRLIDLKRSQYYFIIKAVNATILILSYWNQQDIYNFFMLQQKYDAFDYFINQQIIQNIGSSCAIRFEYINKITFHIIRIESKQFKITSRHNNKAIKMLLTKSNLITEQKNRQEIIQVCSICCEPKPRGKEGIDYLRLQQICYQCWHSHIRSFINRITYRVGDDVLSPFSQGNPIGIVDCINSLKRTDSNQIQEILFRKYSAFTKEVEKCPSQSCDFVYVGQKCKWGSNENIYNCPKCQMPLTPNKSLTLKSLMASFYLMMANKCPKCDIPIQKISGCPHMTCPCGHHFCWYCYKDHPSGPPKRVYQLHNIPQCAFIMISKIVLFLVCLVNLLVTFNGNWILKYIFGILGIVFSVVWRAVILDGFILLQVLFIMMQKRRSFPRFTSYNKKKYILMFFIVNLIGIGCLYLTNQLYFFGKILLGQLVIAGVGFALGYTVIFSIQTWFQFIA